MRQVGLSYPNPPCQKNTRGILGVFGVTGLSVVRPIVGLFLQVGTTGSLTVILLLLQHGRASRARTG